jgi:cyclic nucleotide-binding protein
MHDIAEFLRTHSPFDSLDEETLAEVADSVEVEFYAARTQILDSAEVAEFAYVVRRGSVELVIDGRLLDLIGQGEMFGFVSLLTEGPLGFVARAAEDTLVYRIPICSLSAIAAALGLPAHRPHEAEGDALTAAQVFLAMATHLEARGQGTVRALTRARRNLRAWQLWHGAGGLRSG